MDQDNLAGEGTPLPYERPLEGLFVDVRQQDV
jgi:hypothetical protein